jgi:hypothetical protein
MIGDVAYERKIRVAARWLAKGAWVLTADQVIADSRGRAVELLRIVANPARVRVTEEHVPLTGA